MLSTPTIPVLTELNLSFVTSLTDAAVNKMLVLPDGKRSSLANLKRLYLNSTEITDIALRYVSKCYKNNCVHKQNINYILIIK